MSQNQPPASLPGLVSKHIEAGNVLVLTGQIEDHLERLLLLVGRPISNKQAKQIFANRGTLSSFSSKIEIAYLFEEIDQTAYEDLMIIKAVRNAFAHTIQYVFFDSPHIASKCTNLSNFKAGADAQNCFYERSLEIIDGINKRIGTLLFAKALRDPPATVEDDD